MSREEAMAYGEKFGLTFPVKKSSPYSIDRNLLGRSIEAGPLEDPWTEPTEEVFVMTQGRSPIRPDEPEYIEIGFEQGIPISLNGNALGPVALVTQLNEIVGRHGVGRIDMVENRLVGIKSREIYEAPALLVLIAAHRDLESLTLTGDVTQYKRNIEQTYAQMIYNGLWYSPLKAALDAFIAKPKPASRAPCSVKLFKGNAIIAGRKSENTLYTDELSTYGADDKFDHKAAEGFIYVWGLPTRVWSQQTRLNVTE